MNNDLISRSALKKAFDPCDVGFLYHVVMSKIDNAPTVEEVSVIEFKEPLPFVKAQKIVKTLSKRPQGEWIKHKNEAYECPFCHKQITGTDLNFCVKCGADMRRTEGDVK